MVKNSGDIRVCQCCCLVAPVDSVVRKLDLLVGELEHYGIAVAEIQETKWFGSDVWPAAKGYMLLHSGRPTPNAVTGEISRGEGVGIVLNKKATAAWRVADEEWSSR